MRTQRALLRYPGRSASEKRVESRRGAVAAGSGSSRWPAAFACSPVPHSDPWLRFHVPLIEPDVRISRIRLSDKASCVRTRDGIGVSP